MDDELKEAAARYKVFLTDRYRLEAKLAELDIQREETRKQLESTRRIVAELANMCGISTMENISSMGFTDACRVTLRKVYPEWITAKGIREKLEQGGFDLSHYENPSASIYTILTRLDKAHWVERKQEGWSVFYRWKRQFRMRPATRREAENVLREANTKDQQA